MQVQIVEEKDYRPEREYSMRIRTRPNLLTILSLMMSAAILLGMLAAERLV
jgi:hypothetical protein